MKILTLHEPYDGNNGILPRVNWLCQLLEKEEVDDTKVEAVFVSTRALSGLVSDTYCKWSSRDLNETRAQMARERRVAEIKNILPSRGIGEGFAIILLKE